MARLAESGVCRVLRGDEVFGYHGDVHSPEEAFASVYIGSLSRSPICQALLRNRHRTRLSQFDEEALAGIRRETEGLTLMQAKDFLYFEHRVQGYLHTASYSKHAVLDHRNPLLDGRVLDFLSQVSDPARIDKRLFREAMGEAFPSLWAVPHATSSGLENWPAILRSDSELAAFVTRQFQTAQSPLWEYFNRGAVQDFAQAFLQGRFAKPRDVVDFGQSRLRLRRWIAKWRGRDTGAVRLFHVRPERILMRLITCKLWLEKMNDPGNRDEANEAGLANPPNIPSMVP